MTKTTASRSIRAILFDKDGTLVDFEQTWAPAIETVMRDLAQGSRSTCVRLAEAIGFDKSTQRFRSDSPFLAHPITVWGPPWARVLGQRADAAFFEQVERRLREATTSNLHPLGDPVKLMTMLAARGYRLGVFSNDAEQTVRSHLRQLGIESMLSFVAGYDSGHGLKPEPGPVLAFAKAMATSPSQTAVVGDTVLDLAAARAAGAVAVFVQTGPASHAVSSADADVVLPSAEAIPSWLDKL